MAEWSSRLDQARKLKGWALAELARRSGVNYENLKKYSAGKVNAPSGDASERLARALGVTEQWLRFGTGPLFAQIPIVGFASGGEEWTPVDDHEPGAALEYVDFTMEVADPVAIVVRGQSMIPVYRPGDALVCRRLSPSESRLFLRRDCVVMTTDGRCYIKIVLPGTGPDSFRLRSYSPSYEDIEATLSWAAPVEWVRKAT